MLLDQSHRRAAIISGAAVVIAGAYYAAYDARTLGGASGGTPSGLALGGLSAAMVAFAALLGARRRVATWPLGRASLWMRGHIWLGLVAFPLAVLHSGFRLGGAHSQALMAVFAAVVATGLLGLLLQQVVPGRMTERVPLETVHEQIEHVTGLLRAEADDLVAAVSGGALFPEAEAAATAAPARGKRKAASPALEGSGKLKDFYVKEMRAWLGRERAADARFTDAKKRGALFDRVRTLLPVPLHETLADLESICDERCQLDLERRMHRWLHGWLLLHVPLAAALVALVVSHAVMMLRY